MFALVFDGFVVQIAAAEFPVHPSMLWVNATGAAPQPSVGWRYDGKAFSPPQTVPVPAKA